MYAAYEIKWTEYERGWGTRPDGKSYHKTIEEADAYIKQHWEDEKKRNGDSVPDEYSKPGTPTLVEVTKKIYEQIKKEKVVWIH